MDPIERLQAALSDRYAFERELGAGGMATVHLAQDLKHRRKVAVKVLRPELAASLGPDRFVREIEIAASLAHPHILPLFDSGDADGVLYYVMPYVEGESLRDRLNREGRLPVDEAIRLTGQVASALNYAHEHGVIHRDIKPENILLAGDQAIVADFGIARAVEAAGADRLTGTGLAIGTPVYMSPEQAMGSGELDARTDIYALGCVTYEMLVGQAPYAGSTAREIVARHVVATVPSVRTSVPGVPLCVERAVERALAKLPEDRFPSAAAFAEALVSGTVVDRVRRRQGRRRVTVGAGLTLGAAAIIYAVVTLAGRERFRTIAVLPLTNLTGDTTQNYFIEGVHEALISELAQTGLAVVARRSVIHYRDSDKPVREIARELKVDGVIEGGVFRQGDSVEIETRLISPRSQVPVWTAAYDGNLPNVVALYRGIARAVAGEVRQVLTPVARSRLEQTPSVNPDVYEAYLKGMYHLNSGTPQDVQLGLRYLHEAVDRNPVDAEAWAALAWGYITLGHSFSPPPESRERASEAAERAVRLDPNLAEGWSALAAVKTYYDYDWKGAEEAYQRANGLNPSLPRNHYHYAWYLDLFDRNAEAIREHELARDLDPFTPLNTAWLAPLYAKAGRVDEGIAMAREAMTLQSRVPVARVALAYTYMQLRRWDEAIDVIRPAADSLPPLRGLLARVLVGAGRLEEARAIVRELEQQPTSMGTLWLVHINAALGEWDKALDWLEYKPRHVWMPWYLRQDAPDGLRRQPRFQAVLREMNLAAG